MNDDDFENRLRQALHARSAADADTGAFLGEVHRGAARRRTRRRAGAVAAATLVVAGIVALGSQIIPQTPAPPVASNTTHQSAPGTRGTGTTSPTQHTTSVPAPDIGIASLTSIDSEHQWVLTGTSGNCGHAACAAVVATTDGGRTWGTPVDVGVPVASSTRYGRSVDQVRFVAPSSGPIDGWVYGGDLLSTHDGGATWSRVRVGGTVQLLESWGDDVYAVVASPTGVRLEHAPVDSDDFTPVRQTGAMTGATALAAARGVVGLLAIDNGSTVIRVSTDGTSWSDVASPCPAYQSPSGLTASADEASNVLWLECGSPRHASVFATTDQGATWRQVAAPRVIGSLAGRSTTSAIAVSDGRIELLQPGQQPRTLDAAPAAGLSLIGFTNPTTGYLQARDGRVWRTTSGGDSFASYQVN